MQVWVADLSSCREAVSSIEGNFEEVRRQTAGLASRRRALARLRRSAVHLASMLAHTRRTWWVRDGVVGGPGFERPAGSLVRTVRARAGAAS